MNDEKHVGAQSATEDVSAGSIASDAATARHTPGEWTVFVDGSHVSILATAHPYPTIALVTGGLDDVYEQGLMGPTSHANAHLIAAAPEMKDVLKAIEWRGDEISLQGGGGVRTCPMCGGRRHNSDGDEIREHKRQCALAAAIAKAEPK